MIPAVLRRALAPQSTRLACAGLAGAILSTIGDCAILVAAEHGPSWRVWLTLGVIVYGSAAAAWYAAARITGGSFVEAASAWNLAGVVLTVLVAALRRERQSPGEWLGFALILLGAAVRALSKGGS